MEKIVIQEIHRIKEMMGIMKNIKPNIFESTLDDQDKYELYQYGLTYIGGPDEKNCKKLIQDGKLLEKAVDEGKLKMEPKDIKEFKSNLNLLEAGSVVPGCKAIKPTLIKKFQEGFESNYQKAKINLCWFAENIDKKQLSACKTVPSQTQQTTQQKDQSLEIKLPKTVSGSFNSTNGDDAHNFKELEKKLDELLPQIYIQKINPKMTSVTATITNNGNGNFTTKYSVVVDKSDDGKAWMGFTARGSYGFGVDKNGRTYDQRADGQISGEENEDKKSLKEKLESIGAEEVVNIAGSPIQDKTVPFKEYFVQFTKPKKYPPHVEQNQETPVTPQIQKVDNNTIQRTEQPPVNSGKGQQIQKPKQGQPFRPKIIRSIGNA